MRAKKSTRPPQAKAAAPKPNARVTMASLSARIDALEAEVAALRAKLAPPPALVPARLDGAAVAALGVTVLDAAVELDARQRLGGLVPIPDLRRALRARGVAADDAAVTDALLALERDFRIDLAVAQSPTSVPERNLGIERPGRGLLYYVARR